VKGNVAKGNKLFADRCAQCHGKNGKGGKGTGVTFSRKRDLPIIAPALNNSGFLASATDAMIKDTLTSGREGTPMQSAQDTGLSKVNIDDLVSYIRSFENQPSLNDKKNENPVIIVDSPYTLDETVENLKQAIADQNFTLIRTEPFEHGLVDEGKENKKQIVLHFCNFNFLFEALAIDPRVGMFLPCRVTVVENEGKVQIITINPLQLSKLFNNEELDNACKHMHGVYSGILEDAVL
jgi:cytochrome c oxidase cbb3-type subunit 3